MTADLVFRTRGGPTHGWGHIYRLLTIAEAVRARGLTVRAFLVEGPDQVADFVRKRGFEVVKLPDDVGLEAEEKALQPFKGVALFVAEFLDVTWWRQKLWKTIGRRLLVLDDLMDHRYCADVVICAQDLPAYGNIAISETKRFLTGPQYFPFGPAFQKAHATPRIYPETARTALIAFGGGKYDIAYHKAARALAMVPQLETTVVLGPAGYDAIAADIKSMLPAAKILFGTEDMVGLLLAADIAIVSAGYLKLDAAVTATPALQIATQWHQIPLGDCMQSHHGMPTLGYMSFVTPDDIAEAVRGLLPQAARAALGKRVAAATDGRGLDLVLNEITTLLA